METIVVNIGSIPADLQFTHYIYSVLGKLIELL